MRKQKIYEYNTINSQGATLHLFREVGAPHWKLHNWEGPAIEPTHKDCQLKAEYYLYGTLYNQEDWQELVSQREGLPYYKNPSMKHQLSDYRN
jgi:hypothetical protein